MDYTNNDFKIVIERDGMKGYASIHPEMYREEDGIDFTGNWFVFLLHPELGTAHFELEQSGDEKEPWTVENAPRWIGKDIIQEVTEAIEIYRLKAHLRLNELIS